MTNVRSTISVATFITWRLFNVLEKEEALKIITVASKTPVQQEMHCRSCFTCQKPHRNPLQWVKSWTAFSPVCHVTRAPVFIGPPLFRVYFRKWVSCHCQTFQATKSLTYGDALTGKQSKFSYIQTSSCIFIKPSDNSVFALPNYSCLRLYI